jgi:hypothetical protein
LLEIREMFAPCHGVACAFSNSNRHAARLYPGRRSFISRRAYETGKTVQEYVMDELNGRMMACQLLITGLIARVANNSPDPLRFLTDFRDEIKAVVRGVNIAGMDNTDRVRLTAQQTIDELFSLMKPPSVD